MKVHFIAIGGSAMHNLAIALSIKGFEVTGSDDEIFEPARSRLAKYGILPEREGWDPGRINSSIDAIILGMHAKADNPELLQARTLGLKIYSYPEYLYEVSKDKIRVVIAGSHGKTTITSMILHVLKEAGIAADYMVGAQLEGFEVMVKLTLDSKFMILEGDEYLSSVLDPRPKFHLYRPDIALLSGIAWDHINVFPTFANYISQFEEFIRLIEPGGRLIYCASDPEVRRIAEAQDRVRSIPYGDLGYVIRDQTVWLKYRDEEIPLQVFGKHNIQNIHGAMLVCRELGVEDGTFYHAIGRFKGASKRLQLLGQTSGSSVYKDFAHSPSKLKATVEALREMFPERRLVACLELHTYSSLNKDFLPLYRHCMEAAELPVVYFSHHAVALKRLPELHIADVTAAFAAPRIRVFNDSARLREYLMDMDFQNSNLLLMSSGNFDGLDLEDLAQAILAKSSLR